MEMGLEEFTRGLPPRFISGQQRTRALTAPLTRKMGMNQLEVIGSAWDVLGGI
jgi:hypothetical protein